MERKITISLLVGIIFVASMLRAPITSVGPLIGIISQDLELSGGQSGLITTIPLVAFAVVSPIAPKLAKKITSERTILSALIILILGLGIRSIPSIATLFIGTTIIGCGIAICNVLIPSIIKKEFSQKSGLVTGIFSVSMNLSGAIASGISVPLVESFGFRWNVALSLWAILALVALISWLPQLSRTDRPTVTELRQVKPTIWHSKLAWSVTLFMGIQSFIFYILVAWLPEMLVSQGISAAKAGGMLSLLQFTLLPITFIVPILAEKKANQRGYVLVTFSLFMLGIIGLMNSQSLIITLSIMSIGLAGGMAFSLAMLFFNLRTRDANQAAELSGMAQSVGYLLAAVGPFLFGLLHDQTNSWQLSLYLLIFMTVILLLVGLKASSQEMID